MSSRRSRRGENIPSQPMTFRKWWNRLKDDISMSLPVGARSWFVVLVLFASLILGVGMPFLMDSVSTVTPKMAVNVKR